MKDQGEEGVFHVTEWVQRTSLRYLTIIREWIWYLCQRIGIGMKVNYGARGFLCVCDKR